MAKTVGLLILVAAVFAIVSSGINAAGNATANPTVSSAGVANITSNSPASAPQNLTVANLSITSNLSIYSPLEISFNVTNTGTLATGNIIARISIYGNANYSDTFNLTALSPGQSELALIYLGNVTQVVGSYAVYVDLGYLANRTFEREAEGISGYRVVNLNLAYTGQQSRVSTIPDLKVASIPLLAYLSARSNFISQLDLSYNGSLPVTASILYPSTFSSMLSFSTRTIYLLHNQSLGSSMVFSPQTQAYETTYIIPVNISATQTGEPKVGINRYVQFSVFNYSNSSASVSEQAILYNDSQSADGTLQIDSPANYSLYNTKAELIIPTSAARYISQVSASGASAQITGSSSGYSINWNVGNLQKGQDVYLYYDIAKLSNFSALSDSQMLLTSTTMPSQQNVLKLSKTFLPTLYTNATGRMQVTLFYTGVASGRAVFYLPSVNGASVLNSTQVVNIYSNKLVERNFDIETNNFTGTVLLKMYVIAGGINSTFFFPLVILQRPSSPIDQISKELSTFKYLISLIIVIIIVVMAYTYRKPGKPPEYSYERARSLIQIREQMDREPVRRYR